MKGISIGILVMLVLSLTGCAELKELRVETSEQKELIDQLQKENQACKDSLEATQEQLRQAGLELQAKEEKVREQSEAFTRMQQAMKAELESKQVALKELEGKLTLTMVEAILFDSGKAEVKQEGRDALQKVAGVLKTVVDQEIVVAGYTDNFQIGERLAKIYAQQLGALGRPAISLSRSWSPTG